MDFDHGQIDSTIQELVGSMTIQFAIMLGRRTADMHRALSSNRTNPQFCPEPFSKLYQRSLYQSLRNRILRGFRELDRIQPSLDVDEKKEIEEVLSRQNHILASLQEIIETKITGMKIRIHGKYKLRHVMFTGRDFVINNFEGEPGLAPSAGHLKYSPLRDVADMISSFYYASYGALHKYTELHPEDIPSLEPYVSLWSLSVSRLFLSSYREAMSQLEILPSGDAEQRILLRAFLLDKWMAGVIHELKSQPERLIIPVRGIQSILP